MSRFFAYVASFEQAANGSVRIDLELLDEDWMRHILANEIPLVHDELRRLFANVAVWPTLYALPLALRSDLARANLWFALRTIDQENPAPISLARLTLPPGHYLLKTLTESSWIGLILGDAERIGFDEAEPPDDYAFHTSLGADAAGDREPTKNRIIEIYGLGDSMNAVLQALHLPQIDPALMHIAAVSLAPSPMLASSGATSQYQPFVGAMNIGQGLCAGIWDRNGELTSLIDCGLPTSFNASTRPPATSFPPICVCSDPLVVLSHWDYDHYAFARSKAEVYQLRWIVPQQHIGTVALTVCARIIWDRVNGTGQGKLLLWQSPPPSGASILPNQPPASEHLWLPWGVLERCQGLMPNKNESGCAAFVLVHDQAPAQKAYSAVLGHRGNTIVSPHPYTPPQVPRPSGHYGMQGLPSLMAHPIAPVPGVAPGPISGTSNSQGYILAPGDAAFENIPTIKIGAPLELCGLIATHHGADTFWTPPANSYIPVSTHTDGRIIYSYGMKRPTLAHCHPNSSRDGHPTPVAIANYEANRWTYRMNTCEVAHQSRQLPPLGPPRPHPAGARAIGNAALGWQAGAPLAHDITPAGPRPPATPIARTCSACGTTFSFQF